MFPVLIRIDNKEGLLRPGMNAEVEVHVGRRDDVLAVPNAALRTQRDVASAAQVLGLSPDDVQKQLASSRPGLSRDSTPGRDSVAGGDSAEHATLGARPTTSGGTDGSPNSARRGFGGRGRRGQAQGLGSQYIVFVKRSGRPVPVWIRTGLTDMDYSEVLSGLTTSDSVLVLPSASLVQSQQDMRERFTRATGGGAVPGMQQQSGASGRSTTRP
jgi:HlyD family secretion protein